MGFSPRKMNEQCDKNLTHPPQGRERDKIKQYGEMEGEEL